MGEVMPRHFDNLVLNRIGLMKTLHRMLSLDWSVVLQAQAEGAAAFLTVDALIPSTAEELNGRVQKHPS